MTRGWQRHTRHVVIVHALLLLLLRRRRHRAGICNPCIDSLSFIRIRDGYGLSGWLTHARHHVDHHTRQADRTRYLHFLKKNELVFASSQCGDYCLESRIVSHEEFFGRPTDG
jgi:hypothetical protein